MHFFVRWNGPHAAPLAEGETTTEYADAPAAADASSSASATLAATLYVVDLAGSERADAHAVRTARADAIKKEGGKKGVDNSVFPCAFEVEYVRVYESLRDPDDGGDDEDCCESEPG